MGHFDCICFRQVNEFCLAFYHPFCLFLTVSVLILNQSSSEYIILIYTPKGYALTPPIQRNKKKREKRKSLLSP